MTELSTEDTLAIRHRNHGPNVALSYDEPIHMVAAAGSKMYCGAGMQWLDCVNNVAHVGHCEPSVVQAQCQQLTQLNTNARYLSHVHAAYTKALVQRFPAELSVTYFTNSGSEANDLALRISLAARPGHTHVVVMEGAYHGHLISMIECSPYKFWGEGGRGKPSHVHVMPIPDSYRGTHLHGAASAKAVIAQAEAAGAKIAAFFCESALSCGGQIILPDGYLADVYREMQKHGAVCIADEVQCGFGRCGTHFWGFETQEVLPDIVVVGKAMGNGFPLAGVIAGPELAAAFADGMEYFNTFGGNNVACVTGLAVLQAIERLQLMDNASDVGAYLLSRLAALQQRWPDVIGDVRGMGLFIGIEIVQDAASKVHAPGKAKWLKERLKGRQVLVSTDGPWQNVIKIKPPMVFSRDDADCLVGQMAEVLDQELQTCTQQIASLEEMRIAAIAPGQKMAREYFFGIGL